MKFEVNNVNMKDARAYYLYFTLTLMSTVGEATQCENVNVLLLHVMYFLKQYVTMITI